MLDCGFYGVGEGVVGGGGVLVGGGWGWVWGYCYVVG